MTLPSRKELEIIIELVWCQSACVHARSLLSCLTVCNPMDYSPSGSSVHGILQARIVKWVAISSSRGSFWSTDRTQSLLYWQVGSLPLSHPGSPDRSLDVAVIQSHSCVDSLQPHGLRHARIPLSFAISRSPLSWWCHPTHLILCRPLLLPSVLPSIRVFSESALHIRWPKY